MTTFYKAPETLRPGARTLAGHYYTSDATYSRELERIFYQRWLCVGRADEIPKSGEYFLQPVGNESILVLRTQDGRINAFYNVCRHRGTRMYTEERGRLYNCIQCPYHAWTYNQDGQLTGAPLMEEVPDFRKADYPLHKVAVAQWEGFIFINLGQEPSSFEDEFAPLVGKFAAWNLPELRVATKIEYDVQSNWKLIVQNYSECYHCPLIHPDLARKSPYRSGQNDLFEGPVLGGFMELNHNYGSLTLSGRACAAPIGKVGGEGLSRVYYYALLPNMLLSLHPDYVMCHTLWPKGPGKTHIVCEWLFAPEAMAQPGFDAQDAVGFWDITNRQDWQVCELSQLGVASRVYTPAPYNGQESLLAAIDREYLRQIGEQIDL